MKLKNIIKKNINYVFIFIIIIILGFCIYSSLNFKQSFREGNTNQKESESETNALCGRRDCGDNLIEYNKCLDLSNTGTDEYTDDIQILQTLSGQPFYHCLDGENPKWATCSFTKATEEENEDISGSLVSICGTDNADDLNLTPGWNKNIFSNFELPGHPDTFITGVRNNIDAFFTATSDKLK